MSPGRRRVCWFAVPAALGVLAVGVWLLWPHTAITRANAAKVQPGMTLAEVEAILGGPARDDTTGPVVCEEPPEFAPPDAQGRRYRITFVDMRPLLRWHSDEVQVRIHFDDDGRVTDCHSFLMRRAEETLLDRVRRWLGL